MAILNFQQALYGKNLKNHLQSVVVVIMLMCDERFSEIDAIECSMKFQLNTIAIGCNQLDL